MIVPLFVVLYSLMWIPVTCCRDYLSLANLSTDNLTRLTDHRHTIWVIPTLCCEENIATRYCVYIYVCITKMYLSPFTIVTTFSYRNMHKSHIPYHSIWHPLQLSLENNSHNRFIHTKNITNLFKWSAWRLHTYHLFSIFDIMT